MIWLLVPVPYKALPLWQAVQNYLLERLKEIGGDSKATDAARVWVMLSRLVEKPPGEFMNEAARACGVEGPIGKHTMRKTFGYQFYQRTKDVAMLQEIFGHSAPSI